jgi:hypothetical protein
MEPIALKKLLYLLPLLLLSCLCLANTPPTLSANVGLANATGTSRATASVSWVTGDIIIARMISEGGQSGEAFSLTTATGLTFVNQVNITAGSPAAHTALAIDAATAASSSSGVITGHFSTGVSNWVMWVWVWHGSGGLGNKASTASPSSTKTVSLTPTAADSAIVWGVGDWAGGTVTPSATPTSPNETTRQALGAAGANYIAAEITDQTSAGAVSYGIVTTTTGPFTIGVLEIKGTAGGATPHGCIIGGGVC